MRKPFSLKDCNNAYRLIDFIGKDDDFINNSTYNDILVNYESLIGNLNLLKRITEIKQIHQINCMDYKSALIIEKELLYNCIPVALIDDYKNKDRSYINIESFTRHPIIIPLSYIMWHNNLPNETNISLFCHKTNKSMYNANGDTKIDSDTLLKVKQIIFDFKRQKTDLQKCYLVSNYLQSKVEYIDDDGCDLINSVLNNNCGTCMPIANITTLLLNNPWMNVNVRSVYGNSHVWNIVKIDGELYYIDNTWSITRNPNQVQNKLKATKFTDQYLLFGQESADPIYHNPEDFIPGLIEPEDFDERQKSKTKKRLKRYISTKY